MQAGFFADRRRALLEVAAYAMVPAVYILAFPWGTLPSGEHAGLRHLLAQPAAMLDYLAMFILPARIPIVSGLPAATLPPTAAQVIGVIAMVAIPIAAVVARHRWPLSAFCVLWAAICLAPSSSVVPLVLTADPIRLYPAALGLLIPLALVLRWIGVRVAVPSLGASAAVVRATPALVLGLLLSVATLQVNDRQSDEIVAWRHAASLYPDSPILLENLCSFTAFLGDPEEAAPWCQRAAALLPSSAFVAASQVTLRIRQRHFARAERALAQAKTRVAPHWRLVLTEGYLAWHQSQWARAERAFRWVVRVFPSSSEACVFLADVRIKLGLPLPPALVQAIRQNPPDDALARRILAALRSQSKL
jgi:hypothetical protein